MGGGGAALLAHRRARRILGAMKWFSPRGAPFWVGTAAVLLTVAVVSVSAIDAGGLPVRVVPTHGTSIAAAPATLSPPATAPAAQPSEAGRPSGAAPAQPPGISAEQWQQLVEELSGRADGAAELARLAEYFRFADAVQSFRKARGQTGPQAELQTLAHTIDAGLDTRLQRREVSAAEARALKSAVLEVLQADEASRQATLQQWLSRPMPLSAADAATRQRDAEFMRQQAVIIAAWSTQAPADRDQRVLESRLAALKKATYSTPGRETGTPTPERKSP